MLMLARGEVLWPRDNVGRVLQFADGSSAGRRRDEVLADHRLLDRQVLRKSGMLTDAEFDRQRRRILGED